MILIFLLDHAGVRLPLHGLLQISDLKFNFSREKFAEGLQNRIYSEYANIFTIFKALHTKKHKK